MGPNAERREASRKTRAPRLPTGVQQKRQVKGLNKQNQMLEAKRVGSIPATGQLQAHELDDCLGAPTCLSNENLQDRLRRAAVLGIRELMHQTPYILADDPAALRL